MRLLIIILCMVLPYICMAKPYDKKTIKVAIIDTGYDFDSTWSGKMKGFKKHFGILKPKLCNQGHKDFTKTGIKDKHGHGTHIAGLIAKHAKDANYCIVVLKAWSVDSKVRSEIAMYNAIVYAINIGVDIINYSGGGKKFYLKEYLAVQKALKKGIVLVMAAGNESEQVDYHILKTEIKYKYESTGKRVVYQYTPYYIHRKTGHITTKTPKHTYFPAGYDPRIISVENINTWGGVVTTSNHGEMSYHQEKGVNVTSLLPDNKIGTMTGTSQSTAIRTGKIINKWNRK